MAALAATIFVGAEASAASQGVNGRSGLTGASYLASYNQHMVAMRPVSSSSPVGHYASAMSVPGPSSFALFSMAVLLLGAGGLARRRGR